jgi:hypothetical protein
MTVERGLRMMAGTVILVSMALAQFISAYWYLLTVFVGLNLLQSAFTNWCPGMAILRKMGLKEAAVCATSEKTVSMPAVRK